MIVFLFTLLIILVLLIAILTTASIKIVIKNVNIENIEDAIKILDILLYEKDDKLKLNFLDYLSFSIKLKILAFGKLPILSIKLDNNKIKNIMLKQIDKEIRKHKNIEEDKQRAKELSKKIVPLINLQKGNLNIELGTEDAAFTAIASSIVSIFIAVALPYVADVEKYKNYNYKITPIYLNKNVFFLQFSCIITIKLLHIIKVMCKKDKKGKWKVWVNIQLKD